MKKKPHKCITLIEADKIVDSEDVNFVTNHINIVISEETEAAEEDFKIESRSNRSMT